MSDARKGCTSRRYARAFTLIELLVVVAIIAMLISILLPSLSSARAQAKAVQCSANMRNVGTAMSVYLAQYKVYCPSYVYANKPDRKTDGGKATYDFFNQDPNHPYGYVHWSYLLYSAGKVKTEAFECPQMENAGCPRTNPGPNPDYWEIGQLDQNGSGRTDNSIEDYQAPRVAYTANAAICPRNKFNDKVLPNGSCFNRFVNDAEIKRPGNTILATEFNKNWRTAAVPSSNGAAGMLVSKSHRSLNPFSLLTTSNPGDTKEGGEYDVKQTDKMPFWYGDPKTNFGLKMTAELDGSGSDDMIDSQQVLNSVARHHPGGNGDSKSFSGTCNFLFCDGHVDRKNILETLTGQQWGDRYYSLTAAETGVAGRGETQMERQKLGN